MAQNAATRQSCEVVTSVHAYQPCDNAVYLQVMQVLVKSDFITATDQHTPFPVVIVAETIADYGLN